MATAPVVPGLQIRPTVKQEGLAALLMAGAPLLIAEYRGTKIDVVAYTDKATGKPEQFLKVEHVLEAVDAHGELLPITCEERQAKDVLRKEDVQIGLTRGQRVVLRLAGLSREKGRTVARVDADKAAIAVLA